MVRSSLGVRCISGGISKATPCTRSLMHKAAEVVARASQYLQPSVPPDPRMHSQISPLGPAHAAEICKDIWVRSSFDDEVDGVRRHLLDALLNHLIRYQSKKSRNIMRPLGRTSRLS